MPCYFPLTGYKDPVTGGLTFKGKNAKETMEVACGQCTGCRIDRSRMWAIRISHEASLHNATNGNCFITLTYRDKDRCDVEQLRKGLHIRDDWSLDTPTIDEDGKQKSSHIQAFLKRLRKKYSDRQIKFYQCGEYGNRCIHGKDLEEEGCIFCNVGRPHHHACIFNLQFDDLYQYAVQNGTPRYSSPTLEAIWQYGFVDVGELNFQSAGYVARYIMKKVNGEKQEEHYSRKGPCGEITPLAPEYSSMSNGIGERWLEKYSADCFPADEVPVVGKGVIKKVPRYYMDKFAKDNPDIEEEIKEARKKYRHENSAEYTPQRLMQKYRVKQAQVKLLKRQQL